MEIETDARVAATVAPDYVEYANIRGLQISGQAHVIIDPSDRENAGLKLQTRYPGLKGISEGPLALWEAYQRADFYRLEPTRLVLIDNSRSFGHRDTIELKENSTKAMI